MENCNNNINIPKKTRFLIICCVLLLSSLTASWTLSEKILGNHECFVSITAREMLTDGSWVIPTCNNQVRLQKTPLSYWLVAGIAKLTGTIDEVTARLPSVIFAVLSAAITIYYISRWLNFRIAVIAAAVWSTSLGYIRYAHNARPEMALTFFVTLCFFAFYSAVTAKTRKEQIIQALVFWISFALGNLAKGPAPLPLVILPLFFYIAIFHHWKKLPKLLPIIGFVIFLLIALPWPVAVACKMDWDLTLWKREFIDRFFGNYASGEKSWHYFLTTMFPFAVPWSAFIPGALAAPFYRVWNRKQPVMQYLWLLFVVDLAIITINGGKRQHYIMPIMPAIAVLIGILLEDMAFGRKAHTKKFAKNFLLIHLFAIVAGTLAASVYIANAHKALLLPIIFITATAIIVAVTTLILFAKKKPAYACAVIFIGYCVAILTFYTGLINPLDNNRLSKDFSNKLSTLVPQSDTLIAFGYISNRSVHYFGRPVAVIDDISSLYNRYENGRWVVATADHLEKITEDGRFRQIFYTQKAEYRYHKNASGALFHKSAPVVKDNDSKEP